MTDDIQYLPVNWIDGMKISRKHFEETGLYTESVAKNSAEQTLTDYNFGILPGKKSLDLILTCDLNQQINVDLVQCQGITRNGSRISISAEERMTLRKNFRDIAAQYQLQTTQAQSLLILITVDPFTRIPAGAPLMNENPPRHPFTRPLYKLDIVPEETLNPSLLLSSLLIGKVIYANGELRVQSDFIPPCSTLQSHPLAAAWADKFRQLLENWEQYAVRIIQKINARTSAQQTTALAGNIQKMSEKMLEQIIRQKIRLQWIDSKSAPMYFCVSLLENLQYFQTLQICYAEKDREEMLNYFAEWTDTQPGNLEKQLLRTLQLVYNHYDVAAIFQEIHQSYLACEQLFLKLSQLDFIGKKKGQHIFVIEQEVKPVNPPINPKPNGRWSPLT